MGVLHKKKTLFHYTLSNMYCGHKFETTNVMYDASERRGIGCRIFKEFIASFVRIRG